MFFQRGRRTRAEADRIVIVGAGEVGVHISRRLAAEGKRVLIIDLSRERLSAVEEELDVQTLRGPARPLRCCAGRKWKMPPCFWP